MKVNFVHMFHLMLFLFFLGWMRFSTPLETSSSPSLPYRSLVENGLSCSSRFASAFSTCMITDTGDVKCWGKNDNGQLGQEDVFSRGTQPAELGDYLPPINLNTTIYSLRMGDEFACIITSYQSVKCWGSNGEGQLGLGTRLAVGDETNEMGDYLPFLDFGSNKTTYQLSLGSQHTCSILDDYTLKCWGSNANGQIGYGAIDTLGDAPNEMGDYLPIVQIGSNLLPYDLALGSDHTCILSFNHELKCWGKNNLGQLGYGDTNHRGDAPNEMGDYLPFVQIGSNLTNAKLFSGISHFSCILLQDNTVKCWGQNVY